MQAIDNFLSTQLIYAIGWTIIHSLWQASFIALLMSYYLKKYSEEPAQVRYRISITSLYLLLAASITTFCYYYINNVGSINTVVAFTNESFSNTTRFNSEYNLLEQTNNFLNQNFGLITTMWISGLIIFSLKFIGGLLWVNNIKQSAIPIGSTSALIIMNDLLEKMQITKVVELAESAKASTPMMIGHIKPVILLPIGIINKLELHEVEAILAHELSHISRNDFLQNLVQSIVEILYYYHPAVWWISANVRAERESCCDETAVKMCGNAIHYAKTLVKVEELHQRRIPALAIALAKRKNNLLNRINRILQQPQTKTHIKEKLMATVMLFSFFTVFAGQEPVKHKVFVNPYSFEEVNELEEEVENPYFIVIEKEENEIELIEEEEEDEFELTVVTPDLNEEIAENPYYVIVEKENQEETNIELSITNVEEINSRNDIGQVIIELDDTRIIVDTVPNQMSNEEEKVKILRLKINDGIIEELQIDADEMNDTDIILKLKDNDSALAQIIEGSVELKDLGLAMPLDEYAQVFKFKNMENEFQNASELLKKLNENFSFEDHSWGNYFDSHSNPNFDHFNYKFENNLQRNFDPFDLPNSFESSHLNKPADKIFYHLHKDQLIESGEENQVELTGSYLKINGEKQPSNIWKKYKKLYEKSLGHELESGSKIVLKEKIREKHSFFKSNG